MLFRKVYAKIGFADTPVEHDDDEESDQPLKEQSSPPPTPKAESPSLFSQVISMVQSTPQQPTKAQSPQAIPQLQGPKQSPVVPRSNQSPIPNAQSPPISTSSSSLSHSNNSTTSSSSHSNSNSPNPTPPSSSTPPNLSSASNSPSTSNPSLSKQPSFQYAPNPALSQNSPIISHMQSTSSPSSASSSPQPTSFAISPPPSLSTIPLRSSVTSPVPLIPPPLSSSPVVPHSSSPSSITNSPSNSSSSLGSASSLASASVSSYDSSSFSSSSSTSTLSQATIIVATSTSTSTSASSSTSPPPSITVSAASLSTSTTTTSALPSKSLPRVSSQPQMSDSQPLPPSGRRGSYTPSPLSQPWPSPSPSTSNHTEEEEEGLEDTLVQVPLSHSSPNPTAVPGTRSSGFFSSDIPSLFLQSRNKSTNDLPTMEQNDERAIGGEKVLSPPFMTGSIRQSADRSLTNSGSSATATNEPEEVLKLGWLTKQEKSKESWAYQYFVLSPTGLYFYENENTETFKGRISLDGYEVIIVDPEEVEKEFCFMLTHANKDVYYIHGETRDDMLSWIIALQDVLDNLKPKTPVPIKEVLTPIAETDPKYELVYSMLHAIRFSVSKMAALPYLDIGLEELNASTSFSTDKQGGATNVPGSSYPYTFVDYAPKPFRKIRELFGFNCADYLLSLTSHYTLSELPTPGKSGSFFYYSVDRKFLLKTISATEFDNLRVILPNYFLHILQNPNTMLTRLFGLHRITTENTRNIFFVVMENIFLDYEMDETYDLKGSTIGRKSDGTSSILKDLDWKRRILLDNNRQNALLTQLEWDCKFLEKNNIMDYSFLLGLRFTNHNDEERNKRPFASIFQKEKGGFQATTEDGKSHDIVYYFGIIDIFTTYNIKKQLEHTYKSTIYETKDAISVVDSVKYAHRFRKFIGSICGWKPQQKEKL